MSRNSPTPYPEVNVLLDELLASSRSILGSSMVGMYLFGSLARGDFDPQSSDIDFVVVTNEAVSDEMVPALEAMHARLLASGLPWAAKLEGYYFPPEVFRPGHSADRRYPAVNEGKFYLTPCDSDWPIHSHTLREIGVVIAGPSLRDVISPVLPDDLRRTVRTILREWWEPMLANPARLYRAGYQPYAVLTMCRMLYTLHAGAIASKPAAARWGLETLGGQWSALIERALVLRQQGESEPPDETLDFIRYVLEQSRQMEMSKE